jgi:nickel/cobalt exporter
MIFLATSAIVIGFIHSLAPGHWLPVVLVSRARRWPLGTSVVGALTTALGHVLVSSVIGVAALELGEHLFTQREDQIERYGGLLVAAFGLIYGLVALFRHAGCVGHTHHGPAVSKKRGPFAFLFFVGFTPCVAVLPVFIAAVAKGIAGVAVTMIAFAVGVAGALISATVFARFGVMKFDHPIFEHYGDVLTGAAIVVVGLILFIAPI